MLIFQQQKYFFFIINEILFYVLKKILTRMTRKPTDKSYTKGTNEMKSHILLAKRNNPIHIFRNTGNMHWHPKNYHIH